MAEDDSPRKSRHPRFTLFHVLCLLTVAAFGVGLYGSYRRNVVLLEKNQLIVAQAEAAAAQSAAQVAEVEAENRLLREEAGVLTIDDRSKILAMSQREFRSSTWSYRIYLPEGRDYFVACRVNSLPTGGEIPEWGDTPLNRNTIGAGAGGSVGIGLAPGQYVVTFAIVPGDEGMLRSQLTVRASSFEPEGAIGGGGSGQVLENREAWPYVKRAFSIGGVGRSTEQRPPTVRMLLLNGRSFGGEIRRSSDSTEGVMVWVEPVLGK